MSEAWSPARAGEACGCGPVHLTRCPEHKRESAPAPAPLQAARDDESPREEGSRSGQREPSPTLSAHHTAPPQPEGAGKEPLIPPRPLCGWCEGLSSLVIDCRRFATGCPNCGNPKTSADWMPPLPVPGADEMSVPRGTCDVCGETFRRCDCPMRLRGHTEDDPSLDCSPDAHPAWTRGLAAGIDAACKAILNAFKDKPLPPGTLTGQIEEVRQQVIALRASRDAERARVRDLTEQIALGQRTLSDTLRERDEAREQRDAAEKKRDAWRAVAENTERDRVAQLAAADGRAEAYQKDRDLTAHRLAAANARAEEMTLDLQVSERSLALAEQDRATLKVQLAKATDTLGTERAARVAAEAEVKRLAAHVARLEALIAGEWEDETTDDAMAMYREADRVRGPWRKL